LFPGDKEYAKRDNNCTYSMGIDPVWRLSKDSLTFSNNIKMKMSVIIGIIHMSFGILHKGANAIYFRRPLDLIFEVIVGLVILLGLFGWMDYLIFCKWFTPLDFS
jgi:V-type H+-transporting ATPase subunit a